MSIYNTNSSGEKSYYERVVDAYPDATDYDIISGHYGVQNPPRPGDDLRGVYVIPPPSLIDRIKATILDFSQNLTAYFNGTNSNTVRYYESASIQRQPQPGDDLTGIVIPPPVGYLDRIKADILEFFQDKIS